MRVIIDPIDGSLNAKRGLPHHALSIAVADGSTMADVVFAFVYDFGPREEWWARRGEGAYLNGECLDTESGERRGRDGRLEILGIESADPRWVANVDRRAARLRLPAARARHDRLQRCARSPPPGSTGWSRCERHVASTRPPGS